MSPRDHVRLERIEPTGANPIPPAQHMAAIRRRMDRIFAKNARMQRPELWRDLHRLQWEIEDLARDVMRRITYAWVVGAVMGSVTTGIWALAVYEVAKAWHMGAL